MPRRLLLPEQGCSANHTVLAGQLEEKGSLRYTPAGIPVIEFQIEHRSMQVEAGALRQVHCPLACVALGEIAVLLKDVPVGTGLIAKGFITARSLKQKTPVLHVTAIEFAEIE